MNERHFIDIYELSRNTVKNLKSKFHYHKKPDGGFDFEKIAEEIDKRNNVRLHAQELLSELESEDIAGMFKGKNKREKLESAERFMESLYVVEIDTYINDRTFIRLVKVIEYVKLKYSM